MEKMYVFPLIKKSNEEKKEEVNETDVTNLTNHYMGQVAQHLNNHGFKLDKRFLRDFDFAYEFLRSSMMRSAGMYHPFQDYVDDFDDIISQEEEETETEN